MAVQRKPQQANGSEAIMPAAGLIREIAPASSGDERHRGQSAERRKQIVNWVKNIVQACV
jgi:hypothetical protein